ncbi:MAG: N-acetyltransferase [Serratia proteamaculans]|uniref:N-acetyltransferase n=1 Tax=Serratia proteamaculans TaxID=28151 RepID=A0ABS0TWI0_SERPR|nr:N-acetyltransferase [Serratia proteamaculans]MBI6182725.1 N-acetyltransferase [Serratia proteamaculans]RYM55275.1 N-acetyltransferase [Serratia proteamaculans]
MPLLPKAIAIRPCQPVDLPRLMALWLPSTIAAHPFVKESYWLESATLVRENYLPRAHSWAYWHQGEIVGFISVLDQRFIGALFVDQAFHGRGVGQALMAHVQQRYPRLSLEVYQQNLRACAFYHKQGFQVTQRLLNEETQAYTLIMNWSATV